MFTISIRVLPVDNDTDDNGDTDDDDDDDANADDGELGRLPPPPPPPPVTTLPPIKGAAVCGEMALVELEAPLVIVDAPVVDMCVGVVSAVVVGVVAHESVGFEKLSSSSMLLIGDVGDLMTPVL